MSCKEETKPIPKEIPDIVTDPSTGKNYLKGHFLGKGGFAKCYELTDMDTNHVYAGKIVPKSVLIKQDQKDKLTQEIDIHRCLSHAHIVKFFAFFEDNDFVFILLELCRRRSLMELHKRRTTVTEPEVRFFVKQIVLACIYLHDCRIIHRDLKLGNLFLNDEMEIKIGDFGFATRVDYDGERKRTLCGTPNYIAPEVLGKKGHSYEVDAWSLGCILYTLLIGKPPFETSNLKDTYSLIKKNEFTVPATKVSPAASALIKRLLKPDPQSRPNMSQVLTDEYFSSGFLPAGLPTSCLTMAPRFDALERAESAHKPLLELDNPTRSKFACAEQGKREVITPNEFVRRPEADEPADCYLSEMFAQLSAVIAAKPLDKKKPGDDEAEDPAAVPIFWVSKWVDYSDKHGLGYQLCDNSIGVLYNDSTRLLLGAKGKNVQYIERDGIEHFHTLKEYPGGLTKKIALLRYFRNYMSERLLKAGANIAPIEGDELSRLPYLKTWFRTRSAIILHLSNGTLQINFFQDHTKIILCPLMSACTYIDEKREAITYRMSLIEKFGCCKELASRLKYARTMVERLMSSNLKLLFQIKPM